MTIDFIVTFTIKSSKNQNLWLKIFFAILLIIKYLKIFTLGRDFMARMTKRISNNISKMKAEQEPNKQPRKKYGKDYWLIILIVVNFFLIATTWEALLAQPTSFATYALLEVVLVIMYISRHAKIADKYIRYLNITQYVFMGFILVLFIFNAFNYFFN